MNYNAEGQYDDHCRLKFMGNNWWIVCVRGTMISMRCGNDGRMTKAMDTEQLTELQIAICTELEKQGFEFDNLGDGESVIFMNDDVPALNVVQLSEVLINKMVERADKPRLHEWVPITAVMDINGTKLCRVCKKTDFELTAEGKLNRCDWPALSEVAEDSRGNRLYVKPNEVGGHRYWSDERGDVVVWDTSLVSEKMMLLALLAEKKRRANASCPICHLETGHLVGCPNSGPE